MGIAHRTVAECDGPSCRALLVYRGELVCVSNPQDTDAFAAYIGSHGWNVRDGKLLCPECLAALGAEREPE